MSRTLSSEPLPPRCRWFLIGMTGPVGQWWAALRGKRRRRLRDAVPITKSILNRARLVLPVSIIIIPGHVVFPRLLVPLVLHHVRPAATVDRIEESWLRSEVFCVGGHKPMPARGTFPWSKLHDGDGDPDEEGEEEGSGTEPREGIDHYSSSPAPTPPPGHRVDSPKGLQLSCGLPVRIEGIVAGEPWYLVRVAFRPVGWWSSLPATTRLEGPSPKSLALSCTHRVAAGITH
ncbi:hypothetical protein LZ30DRAFT_234210 [Colletotrichum cereale]|nr:hypothetical protein LZ30DRAFT_234210 [Colletotrichum cereale]